MLCLVFGLVLGLGLFGLIIMVLSYRRARAGRQKSPKTGQSVSIDGREVHYMQLGHGEDVVLIHGSNGSLRDMMATLALPLSQNFRVTVFDRPGQGYSDTLDIAENTPQGQARHLAKAARAIGLENPLVVGQSLGGTVALAWALEEPDYIRGLVPISPVAMPWTTGIGLYYWLTSHPILGGVVCHIIAAIAWPAKITHDVAEVFEPQPIPEGYIDQLSVDLGLSAHNSRSNGLVRGTLVENLETMQALYHTITTPTEVIHGSLDTMVPKELHIEGLLERLPNAEFTLLEGVGHMPHHSHRNDVIEAILRVDARTQSE